MCKATITSCGHCCCRFSKRNQEIKDATLPELETGLYGLKTVSYRHDCYFWAPARKRAVNFQYVCTSVCAFGIYLGSFLFFCLPYIEASSQRFYSSSLRWTAAARELSLFPWFFRNVMFFFSWRYYCTLAKSINLLQQFPWGDDK